MPPKKHTPSAIGIQREEVFLRDGFRCVPCVLLGACDPKGIGWCGGNQLVSSALAPAVYLKLDALRVNASLRLHLSHLHGKAHDEWRNMVASCACHNLQLTKDIRAACLTYTEQFPETGTERFEAALARRPAEKETKKIKAAATRHAAYQKATKKYGKPTIPSAPLRSAPTTATPKKAKSGKWDWAPIHPTYLH